MRYTVVIHKDEGSSYGVTVPDLPGCFSGGDTLEEAFDNAREAISGHLETLLMDNQPIPKVLPLDIHQSSDDYRDGLWGFVDVDLTEIPHRSVRVNITIPAPVLALIDEAAAKSSESRSSFLTHAALEHIADRRERTGA